MKTQVVIILVIAHALLGNSLDSLYTDPEVSLFDPIYNETMEWGTYKPNQFFAIKDRSVNPLTVGLLWAVPKDQQGLQIRHTMRYPSGDGVKAYYEYHDGWGSSRQIIEDPLANARFEIDFVKTVSVGKSSWKAMIDIKPLKSD
jgi:hypothetical protein